ncbi:hypothetical protein [Lonepinella sp. MS14436]|uniref:hypothetical protein n=1 Tax=Lonepinella sp. MS14436 TaxID=3003619 RepID=UPI0036DC7B4F
MINNFVFIKRPVVKGNIVTFHWYMDYDHPNSVNSIYVDYYDLDISSVPLDVHYNTIIGLLLNRLINSSIDAIITTEDPISKNIADFWIAYHNLENVYFSNLSEKQVKKSNILSSSQDHIGILYGGGKDSYCALDVFKKHKDIKNITLISFVIPDSHVNVKQLEDRRDELILSPIAQHYDVEIIKIKTNVRGIIKNYHLELYFAPLGVLAWLNKFQYITFSYEYCHYFIPNKEQLEFGFERSQYAHIKRLSDFYTSEFSAQELSIFNANQHLTELSSFGYLAKNDSDFYKTLVMCESTVDKNQKWCCSCTKCAEFVLFSLFYHLPQTDIDFEWFFAESPWIKKVINELNKDGEKGRFFKGLTFSFHFDSFKFCITNIKMSGIRFSNPLAQEHFDLLVTHYYDASIYNEDHFYIDVLGKIYPSKLVLGTYDILSNILPNTHSPLVKNTGLGKVKFDQNIQPQIKKLNPYIVKEDLLHRLTVRNITPKFNSDPVNSYITDISIVTNGKISESDLLLNTSEKYIDIYIEKNLLNKNDGYDLCFKIKVNNNSSYVGFKLNIPHFSKELDDRFFYSLEKDEKKLSVNTSQRNIYCQMNIDKEHRDLGFLPVKLSLYAKRDLEPWNWGKASRVRINEFELYDTQEKLKNKLNFELLEL